ncbi:ECF transporter S component [Clostridium sp. SYSU_GA19001]|uniref:ECF transporter S component n=1 Tax=Clostridium caldaquaticum TaxID=2940653 RepID=UPI00207729E9|nr:ECF transporter S component [Clostridium caldaquaticum]MCM8711148.1 ECF transporter S component [Clostridium caldaquaticum]
MNQNVSTTSTSRKLGTRQLTIVGMLSAISIIMALTPLGFIQLPMARATLMHIPVIIGALVEGPVVGMLIGLMFGGFSLVQNYVAPSSALFFAFQNPLVSVLPRVLIPITAFYTYKYMIGKSESLKIGVAAAVGTATNTFGVLTMIYLLYREKVAVVFKASAASIAKVIYGIALTNGIPEMLIAVIIIIPVIRIIRRAKK